MNHDGFANPWEHVRLLSDSARNQALIDVLSRHAPGKRVLEVGCGTGLLSCITARLGATRVYAVEPTPLWMDARRLVEANGLGEVVEVLPGLVQDVPPQPVDLAFSELLNADPFYEGVLDAMEAAARWLQPGGRLVPRRLKVYACLVRASGSAREARSARAQVRALGDRFDLEVESLLGALEPRAPYRYHTTSEEPASEPVLLYDLALGTSERPLPVRTFEVMPSQAGPVGGAMVWFEAELDDDAVMSNRPGATDHWGQLICAWAGEVGAVPGRPLTLTARVEDGELEIDPPR